MKLTRARERVLLELYRNGGDQSHRIAIRLGLPKVSVWSALRWLREAELVEFVGYWSITSAGRSVLVQEIS